MGDAWTTGICKGKQAVAGLCTGLGVGAVVKRKERYRFAMKGAKTLTQRYCLYRTVTYPVFPFAFSPPPALKHRICPLYLFFIDLNPQMFSLVLQSSRLSWTHHPSPVPILSCPVHLSPRPAEIGEPDALIRGIGRGILSWMPFNAAVAGSAIALCVFWIFPYVVTADESELVSQAGMF